MTHKLNRITAGIATLAVAIGGMTACASNQQPKETGGNTAVTQMEPVVI